MLRNSSRTPRRLFAVLLSLIIAGPILAQGDDKKPKLSSEAKQARSYALTMLDEMEDVLREHYYDQTFRGVDLKARIQAAKERVKTLEYNWQMYRVLVQVLMEFNDSHTRMMLPPRTDYFQYGLGYQMIGDDCVVTYVKHGSDAKAKGIERGDQILKIGKHKPNRNDLWKINYLIYKLDPAKTLDLTLRKIDGSEQTLTITAKTMTDKEFRAELKADKEKRKQDKDQKDPDADRPFKCSELSKEQIACRLDTFVVEKSDIDKMMRRVREYPKFILDLRGNGGGYVFIEEYFLSHFFDRPVKIATVRTKKKEEARMTKVLDADKRYAGELAVLIDSNSASASEMTARVLQLEKRAKIYGDYSSGSVMTSISVPFVNIMSAFADYAIIKVGMSVTVADVIMSDGSRLEHVGVVPDVLLQPRGLAFRDRMDPVLAYVSHAMGTQLSPEDAGKLYFLTDKDPDDDEEVAEK